jgi:hypothetical protein
MESATDRPSISLAQIERLARLSAKSLAAEIDSLDRWSREHEALDVEPLPESQSRGVVDVEPSTDELVRRLQADFAALLLENFHVVADRQKTGAASLATS